MKYTNTSRILIYTHREAMRYTCLVGDYLNSSYRICKETYRSNEDK